MSRVWAEMKEMGALDSPKLARFSAANLLLVATAACKRCGEEDIKGTVEWLKMLQLQAQLLPKEGGPRMLLDWNRKVAWYSADLKRSARKEVVAEAQAAHHAAGAMSQYPATSAVTTIVGKRVSAKKRKVRNEEDREKWALRALKVLLTTGLLPVFEEENKL